MSAVNQRGVQKAETDTEYRKVQWCYRCARPNGELVCDEITERDVCRDCYQELARRRELMQR